MGTARKSVTGHVKCRDENSMLMMELKGEDTRPVGWPKKSCSKVGEEDMLNITEDMAEDRQQQRQFISCLTRDVIQKDDDDALFKKTSIKIISINGVYIYSTNISTMSLQTNLCHHLIYFSF